MPDEFQIIISALLIALVFVGVHLGSHKIYGFSKKHKQSVLSFSGGIAASFVFLDLLPSLQNADPHLQAVFGNTPLIIIFLEKAIFAVAFIGFITFFALEYLAFKSRYAKLDKNKQNMKNISASRPVFYIHLGLIAWVSLIITYSLRFEVQTTGLGVILYTVALSLHFFVSDRAMEEHYQKLYVKYGRYVLAIIPLIGWSLSILFPERISEAYVLLAFVAGVVLFNVVKNEIPNIGRGSPLWFFAGALFYSVILLMIPWVG